VKNHEWEKLFKMEREQKNTFFSTHPQSPIPLEERKKKIQRPEESYLKANSL
jgi:hypothetical protein